MCTVPIVLCMHCALCDGATVIVWLCDCIYNMAQNLGDTIAQYTKAKQLLSESNKYSHKFVDLWGLL